MEGDTSVPNDVLPVTGMHSNQGSYGSDSSIGWEVIPNDLKFHSNSNSQFDRDTDVSYSYVNQIWEII